MRASPVRYFLLVLSMMLAGSIEASEDCTLKLLSSLDLLDSPAGLPVVAVTFNGRPAKMILDTGAYWSGIVPSAAEGLKIKSLKYLGIGMVGAGGGVMRTAVIGSRLQLGRLDFAKADFFIFARDNKDDPDLIGNIGANILKLYDVEIDYAGRKVKIYSQDHCAGKVVTWPVEELAKIPFKLNEVGHISLPVALDGHDYRALLDTGATSSYLDKKAADGDFGLTAETATAMGASDTLDGKDLPTFYHRFAMLDLGGLEFRNPDLAFSTGQEEGGWGQERMPSMILGMHQLRGLHFYIAYGERMIYASVAKSRSPLDPIDHEEIAHFTETAQKQLEAKDYQAAATSFTQALRIAPNEAWLYAARAYAHHETGDVPAALADLDEAIRLDPKSVEQRLNRTLLLLQGRQFDAAEADCMAILAENPQSSQAQDYLRLIRQLRAGKGKG